MASSSSSSAGVSPSSSSAGVSVKYDVFISYRGEDTRYSFTDHLYKSLCSKKINTFIDSYDVERGDEISKARLKAIKESKIAVVFWKGYASSKWCLDELAKIIECKKARDLMARSQKGTFGEAFVNHEEKQSSEKVMRWRNETANPSGFVPINVRENTDERLSTAFEWFLEAIAAKKSDEIEFDGETDPHTISDDCIARVNAINPFDMVMTLAQLEVCCFIAKFSDIFPHLVDVQCINKRQYIPFLTEEIKNFTLQDNQLNSKDDTEVIRGSIIFSPKSFLRVTAIRIREDDGKNNLKKAVQGDTVDMSVNESSIGSKKFSNILEDESAQERKQSTHQPGSRNSIVFTMNSMALMVIIATIITAQGFTFTSKLRNYFFRDVNLTGEKLQVQDLIYGRLPSYFYLMVFNSAAFINTMFMIALLVWQLYLGIVLAFLVICMCIVYVLVLNTVIPSFSIGVGTYSISSILLVWLLVIALTVSGIAIPKYCLPRVLQLFNRLWMKITHSWKPRLVS